MFIMKNAWSGKVLGYSTAKYAGVMYTTKAEVTAKDWKAFR